MVSLASIHSDLFHGTLLELGRALPLFDSVMANRRWWLIEVRYVDSIPAHTGRALSRRRPPAPPGPHPLSAVVVRHARAISLARPLWRGTRRIRRRRPMAIVVVLSSDEFDAFQCAILACRVAASAT